MRRWLPLLVLLAGCKRPSSPTPAVAEAPAPPPPSVVERPVIEAVEADPAHLEEEVARLAQAASEQHRRLVVFFQAAGCTPCREAKKAFVRHENASTFKGWSLVPVDMERLPEGRVLGLPVEEIPLFARLDPEGKVEATMTAEAFGQDEDPHMIDAAFRDFLAPAAKPLP